MLSSSNRSVFDIHIRQPLRLLTPGFVNRGKFAVARGPILYAVDSCPEGWDFDDIALSLSSKQPLSALVPFEENGWTAFRAKAYRTEHHISQLNWQNVPQSLPQAEVVLRPFFFAGLGKNLSYAQHTEAGTILPPIAAFLCMEPGLNREISRCSVPRFLYLMKDFRVFQYLIASRLKRYSLFLL